MQDTVAAVFENQLDLRKVGKVREEVGALQCPRMNEPWFQSGFQAADVTPAQSPEHVPRIVIYTVP